MLQELANSAKIKKTQALGAIPLAMCNYKDARLKLHMWRASGTSLYVGAPIPGVFLADLSTDVLWAVEAQGVLQVLANVLEGRQGRGRVVHLSASTAAGCRVWQDVCNGCTYIITKNLSAGKVLIMQARIAAL